MSAAPAYLAPTWRYAGDDWAGGNALTYTVYSVPPVYAADGVTITTPGTPMDLTGYEVTGTISYRAVPATANDRFVSSQPAPPLQGVVGAIVGAPTAGQISLSVQESNTTVPRQDISAWGTCQSRLVAQPKVVDPSGNTVTVGLQPLFVF